MKCTVNRMDKNLRYRILTIKGNKYIMDMGGESIWKLLFPIFYWLLPNRVYKLETQVMAERLTAPTVEEKTGTSQIIWPLLASILATSLSPLANYFEITLSTSVNILIVSTIVVLMFILIGLLSRKFKEKVYQNVDLSQLTKGWLWVFPVPLRAALISAFLYVGCMGLGVLAMISYIEDGNWLILLFSIPLLFVGMVLPGLLTVVEGKTLIKILGGERADIYPHIDF